METVTLLRRVTAISIFGLGASLTACGGGSSGSAVLPGAHPVAQSPSVDVQFSITIPQSLVLSPKYISSATQSAQIVVTPGGSAPLTPVNVTCTATCSGTVQAPVGSDVFSVTLFDQPAAAGHALSQGVATQTILAGQQNSVNLSFGGIVAGIVVSLGSSSVSGSGSTPVYIAAKDAAGRTIVGAANYINAIALINSDTSGATSLSTVSVASPATPVTLTYTSNLSSATIGASAAGVSQSQVTAATISKAASGSGVALMSQTSAVKVNGSLNASSSAALGVAISETGDQTANGRASNMTFGNLVVGSGTSAQSSMRVPQSFAAQAPDMGWGQANVRDLPDDTSRVRALLRGIPPGSLGVGGGTRGVRSSTVPNTLVVGSTTIPVWTAVFALGGGGGVSYTQVPSTLEAQTPHGNIWIDSSLLSGPNSSASFQGASLANTVAAIASDFENDYASDVTHFGAPDYAANASGVGVQYATYDASGAPTGGSANQYVNEPADGRINAEILNSANLGAGVGGYFSSTNFVPQSIWNYYAGHGGGVVPQSNEAPFIFVGWFSRSGAAYELNEDLVRGMAHEFQHLVNFVHHSILPAAASSYSFDGSEDPFINEGLSMLSQDLALHAFNPSQGFDVDDAMGHAAQYLSSPQNYSLTGFIGIDPASWGGDGSTPKYNCGGGCYGSAYLFQRYLRDRFGGDAFTHGMEDSGATGFANLQANAGNESAQNLLGDFAVAIAANTLGITTSGPYSFGTLDLNGTYSTNFHTRSLHGAASERTVGGNASATVTPPVGGVTFFTLAPGGTATSVSIVDQTSSQIGLAGGIAQR